MKTANIIETLLARVAENCTAIDTDEQYDSMLDDCYSLEAVGGPFACMSASRVLLEVDPIAYRCGKNDWLDAERKRFVEVGEDYYDADEVEAARQGFVTELEDEISELEAELEEANDSDEEESQADVMRLDSQLNILRAKLAEVEKYAF